MRAGLISDTHGKLRPEVFHAFEGVDVILHAGDIGDTAIITELQTLAPVHAVHGNTDGFDVRALYGDTVRVTLEDVRIVVVHGHLLGSPNPGNLRAAHADCDVIVYGHTHTALLDHGSPLVVNPGAAGPARFRIAPSVAILSLPSLEVEFRNL